MTTTSRCGTLLIALVLGAGCGGDDDGAAPGALGQTPPGAGAPAATAGTPGGVAAGTGAAPAGAAGMAASAAGRSGGSGVAGSPPVTMPVAGMPAGAAGAPAGAAGAPAMPPVAGTGGPVAGMDGAAGGPPASTAGKLPRVETTDGPGPFNGVEKVKNTPPGGWLIYPKELGRDGVKHPIFVFGPGGGTTPDTYEQMGMHWDRYGSYGFVIYVLPRSTGDGSAMKAGLDWVLEQNDDMSSPLYQKLDTTRICAAGHSMGSVTTFDFMPDERVTTTIHISGGSQGGSGPRKLTKPTMFLCGPSGDVAYPQCETDFEATPVPTYYTIIEGSSHLTSGRMGWPAIIAWMLWHLADHEEWKDDFLEPDGQFRMGMYRAQIKNW